MPRAGRIRRIQQCLGERKFQHHLALRIGDLEHSVEQVTLAAFGSFFQTSSAVPTCTTSNACNQKGLPSGVCSYQ